MADDILTSTVNTTTQADLIGTLVGEGKTYKTVEDLAKGKLNADVHIQKIELENKEMREKLAAAKTVDDLLEKINANTSSNVNNDGTNSQDTSKGLDAESIKKLVEDQIQGREVATTRARNRAAAEAKLKEIYGDKAKEVFEAQASSPELREALLKIAEVDPAKFVGIFQKETVKDPALDTGDSSKNLNLNLSNNTVVEPGTELFYRKLRKENPKAFYSNAVQLQMHKDALANPNKYFGRN